MSKLIFSCGEEDEQECICISELVKPTSVLTTAISILGSHIGLCCPQVHSVPVLLLFLSPACCCILYFYMLQHTTAIIQMLFNMDAKWGRRKEIQNYTGFMIMPVLALLTFCMYLHCCSRSFVSNLPSGAIHEVVLQEGPKLPLPLGQFIERGYIQSGHEGPRKLDALLSVTDYT